MATRAEWEKRVQRWDKSGLSAAAFAADEGLAVKRLLWWRWKLRAAPPVPAAAAPLSFLPVHVVDSAAPPSARSAPIEIVLPNGRVVRVPPGFDPTMLGRVLTIAAEEAAPC
jgi:transposase